MVKSLIELDRYRWSGHSVLVGRRRRTWQDRGEILSHFGLKKREAVKRYREFIEDGFNMGRREDLTGGGLRRSAGVFELRRAKEYWQGDERILGDSDFVNEVLKLSEEELTHQEELKRQGWDLNRIVNEVCHMLSVDPDDLHKKRQGQQSFICQGFDLLFRLLPAWHQREGIGPVFRCVPAFSLASHQAR